MDVKYAYYSTSKGYRVVGGTAAHFLKADGSLDNNNYLTTDTAQHVNAIKSFITSGGNAIENNTLRVYSTDGSNPGLTFLKNGVDAANMYFDGIGNFKFRNGTDTDSRYIFAKGYRVDGLTDASMVLGGGGSRPVADFNTAAQSDTKYLQLAGGTMTGAINHGYTTAPIISRNLSTTTGTGGGFARDTFQFIGSNGIVDAIGHYGRVINATVGNVELNYGYIGGSAFNVKNAIRWTPDGRVGVGLSSTSIPADGYQFHVIGKSLLNGDTFTIGNADASSFRNGSSSVLVKQLNTPNQTQVTSFGIKLTSPLTSNMMGSFTVTVFAYTGVSFSFRINMYKFQNGWAGVPPSITWLHGNSLVIDNLEFYKEDDANMHIKVNIASGNLMAYTKVVITDVLANSGDALHNPDTYTISTNPDNTVYTLQVTKGNVGFIRDNFLNLNNITTNTAQTGLTGNKTTAGDWVFNGGTPTHISLLRPSNGSNVTMSYGFDTPSYYVGLGNTNTFAFGTSPDLNLASNRHFWLEFNKSTANLRPQGGSALSSRDVGGYSITTTTDISQAEMILRHNWSAKNQTFGIGGTGSVTSGGMTNWGMFRWLNDRTTNGNDGFFGWYGNADVLQATALAGVGIRMVTADSIGRLATLDTATVFVPYDGATKDLTLADKNLNFTLGSISKFENGMRVFNNVFQKYLHNLPQTGIISFKFPQATTSATMFDVTINIYGYNAGYLGKLRVTFYKTSAIGMVGSRAMLECSDTFPSTKLTVGIDLAGNVCINLGETTTVWNTYTHFEVQRVQSSYTGANSDWSKGWSQTVETVEPSVPDTYKSLVNIVPEIISTRGWAQQNYIPLSQKGSANGVATLDSTVQVPNAQIPTRLTNKVIALGGETADLSFTGLYDRNQLALADKENTVTSIINGAGAFTGGMAAFNNTILNSKSDVATITGTDSTTEVVITVVFNSVLNNYGRGRWQPFIQTRLQGSQMFRDATVEVMDSSNVWYSPAEFVVPNMTLIPNSGLFLFPESGVGTASIKAVRFKMSNVLTTNGVAYISNIGFRHVSHSFAPQFPHRGENNKFFGVNDFSLSPIVPVATIANQAVNFGQISSLYKSDFITGKNVSNLPTTLEAEVPNGGFISSYATSTWGGADRPTGASYGGYIKFKSGGSASFNNDLDFYYNNGHGGSATRLWLRTKNNTATANWLEFYHSGNLNVDNFAKLNAVQTFSEVNTFTKSPVVPFANNVTEAVNLGQVSDSIDVASGDILGYVSSNYIPKTEKGTNNGVATLDASGLVPSTQLPSYVDDVIEGYYRVSNSKFYKEIAYTNEIIGEAGKIYVSLDTNKTYRWSGSSYIFITSGAVDSVNGQTGVVVLNKTHIGLPNVDNTADATKNVLSATKLTTSRSIGITGDATYNVNFDGSTNVTSTLTLANSGVTAGTYKSVTVDAKGRVTGGTNPTTLAGYGITDAMSTSHAANGITATNISNWNTAYTNNHTHSNKTVLDGTQESFTTVLKNKLDGLSNYTLPIATTNVYGGVRLITDTQNNISPNAVTTTLNRSYAVQLNNANQMLVNIPWTDTVYTHQTTAGNRHIPAGGSTNQILKWQADGNAVWANADYQVAGNYMTTDTDQNVTGSKSILNGFPFKFKATNSKTWTIHKPNANALIFAPSTVVNGENWDWQNQVSFDDTGTVEALKFRIRGGSATQFMKADGSLDATPYVTTNTFQGIEATKVFNAGAELVLLGDDGNKVQSFKTSNNFGGHIVSGWLYSHYTDTWKAGCVRNSSSSSEGFAFDLSTDSGATFNRIFRIQADGNLVTNNFGRADEWKQAHGWGDHAQAGYVKPNSDGKLSAKGFINTDYNSSEYIHTTDGGAIHKSDLSGGGTFIDEIINDQSDYAIRLDPHEYEIDSSGSLDIDDRNRLIHIIGEQIKMSVNFKEIYPKQQIVIYNFDQGGTMAVKVYGKTIYNIKPGCFIRLYVTKSRRVIVERDQPNAFIW